MLATEAGDTDGAIVHLERSSELAEQLGDQALLVAALNNLALAHRTRGEHARALELTTRRSASALPWATGIVKRRCTTTSPTCCRTPATRTRQ
jgi:hypothetical protein